MGNILLVMGHRNKSGGNEAEADRTPKVVNAVAPALQAAGHTVHVLQREDGDGDPNFTDGKLGAVARRCTELIQAHDIQVMIDAHFQGTSNPTSGCFCIFPDSPGDSKAMNPLDVSFAMRLASDVSALTGIRKLPLGEPGGVGIMSERQTGVGETGDRLGMFELTVPVRETCVRVVMEHGDISADRAFIDAPGFFDKLGKAYVRAINNFWPNGHVVPVEADFHAYQPTRLFHTQAGALGRQAPSTSAEIMKRFARGEAVFAEGFQHAEMAFGDDRWIRITTQRWIHRSGIVEDPES